MKISIVGRWRWALVLPVLAAGLAACGGGDDPPAADSAPVPDAAQATVTGTAAAEVEPAPELVGLGEWINSEPLTLAQLRGEPVLLVFWASW